MNTYLIKRERFSVFLSLLFLFLMGCNALDDSEVGEQEDLQPIAKALVVGLNSDNKAREGAEVILTGKDSDGLDTPIFRFNWSSSASNSIPIQLRELTTDTVSFTAPEVATETDFTFDLEVTDADGGQASDSVTITVVPARDLDRFLSFDAIAETSLNDYQVVLIPDAGQLVDAGNSAFTLNLTVVVHYPDRRATCAADGLDADGNACLNYANNASRELTDFNQTIVNVWQRNSDDIAIDTVLTLPLPKFIVNPFNQNILDDNLPRESMLDLWKVDDIDIEITYNLTTSLTAQLSILGPNEGTQVNLDELALQPVLSQTPPVTITAEKIRNSGKGLIESKETARAYYQAIDPLNSADTLNKWLVHAGFADDNADGTITLKPEAVNGTDTNESDFAHAVYTNNFDLGFGRDMFVRVADDGSIYSYVINYPTLEAAIKKISPLATVVMEYSPPAQGLPTDDKFVKFYTYIPDENGQQIRVTDFDFDGRGQKYMPGVCAACHGGEPKEIEVAVADYQGNIGAAFLPWDLDSFLFSDTDPAILDIREVETDTQNLVYNRTNQEEQFRKLNQAVYHTYIASGDPRFNTAIDLMGGSNSQPGWYSDTPCTPGGNKQGCLSGSFAGDYVPDAWSQHSELYTNVVARHCRGCHIAREGTDEDPNNLQMATPDDLLSETNRSNTKVFIFEKGVMPLARLTMDRFWTGTGSNQNPSQILWNSLGEIGDTPKPGAPLPKATMTPIDFYSVSRVLNEQPYLLTKVGRSLVIDASASLFTDDFQWALLDASNVPGFENCLNDPQALVANGDKAELTAVTENLDNQYYCIQLTGVNDVGTVDAETVFVRVVGNRLPEILFSSNCDIENECLSVSELNADASSSTIMLAASTQVEPLDFTDPDCALDPDKVCTNVNTLFQVVDEDVSDGLDPQSIITFELRNTLLLGSLSATSFGLQDLLSGDVIAYETSEDEVGAAAVAELLEFDVYDNGVIVPGLSLDTAEININPVSDNNPTFGTVDDTSVNFGGVFNSGVFEVTDNDEDTITLTTVASTLGSVQTTELSNNASLTTYRYSFTAKTAAEIAGTGDICSTFGIFDGGNTSSFQLRADDGSQNVGIPVSKNILVTLNPSLAYASVASAYATKTASGGQCSACHENGPGSPNWATSLAGLRSVVSLNSPPNSLIFTNGQAGSGHTGGTYSVDLVNNSADRNLLEWIYQCGPQ